MTLTIPQRETSLNLEESSSRSESRAISGHLPLSHLPLTAAFPPHTRRPAHHYPLSRSRPCPITDDAGALLREPRMEMTPATTRQLPSASTSPSRRQSFIDPRHHGVAAALRTMMMLLARCSTHHARLLSLSLSLSLSLIHTHNHTITHNHRSHCLRPFTDRSVTHLCSRQSRCNWNGRAPD